ncbi:MAG TPA: YMGG-like glycine zipper-containing protein [Pyrinomonadaceae bacterium]|nr:YMGG-like glycine zipper-containing protein [Pyrinomonadaceae bacterium]
MIRKSLVALIAIVLLTSGIQAQRQSYRGTFTSVRQLILRIENRTTVFRNSVNAQSQTASNNGALRSLVQSLEASVDNLRLQFDQKAASTSDVEEVLRQAVEVDALLGRQSRGAVSRNWNTLRADLRLLASTFRLSWPTIDQVGRNNDGVSNATSLLTGTYRLDVSKSDDPGQAADRATQSINSRDRARLRDEIAARLEAPDQIAIQVRGRDVTLASSRAPQITFTADGAERVDTLPNGQTTRARATLTGDQLMVSSTGDTGNQFSVNFDPMDRGQTLSVTRRVYTRGLSRPVVMQSVYQRESAIARFDINPGPQTYPGTTSSQPEFIVVDNERVIAVLNTAISTETAREGDRFTMTVRQPYQFEGATIEGHISNVERSGRITGRSQMTLNFDTIRLRDGRSHRFAGVVEAVRSAHGENVRIDNEGSVRDNSQTTRTAQRAAIGTAVGAIIGAIAGGGKGAAIGAIVGAGGGAGSVYVQGRDDLELAAGSEVTIRASAPR